MQYSYTRLRVKDCAVDSLGVITPKRLPFNLAK